MKVGTKVTWNTPQGKTHGKVVERKTDDDTLAGQHFTASQDEPMFHSRLRRQGPSPAGSGRPGTTRACQPQP